MTMTLRMMRWLIATALIAFPTVLAAQMRVGMLKVEHMVEPTTVEVPQPRLSWVNEVVDQSVRGERQTAYRIVVASSEEKLEAGDYDLWDSGRTECNVSTLIPYAGKTLSSGQDCYWRVQTWDTHNKVSTWSPVGRWGMGLLSPADWKAKWICAEQKTGAPLFRNTFSVDKLVRQAKVFVTAGGYFELYINGCKVGEDYLVPNFTNYTARQDLDKGGLALDARFTAYRVMYLSYDVTHQLRDGSNVIGAILGDGFYRSTSHWVRSFGTPCFLCQIEVTYEDGSRQSIVTDDTWLTKPSPITMTGVYDGEVYDARLETPLWAEVGADESGWQPVMLANAPIGKLTAHTAPTDRICEVLSPIKLARTGVDCYEVEFEKEISGWVRLMNLQGPRGRKVSVKYLSESPQGREEYILKGTGDETYAPRFTWYVFSKVIVSGIEELSAEQIQAEAVNTVVSVNSEFHTSHQLLNTINSIWQRTQLDNMHGGVASDCPHRERSPYTGDGQIAAAMVMLNFDAAAFYQKWVRDMRDAQNPVTGYVPNGAPWQPGCGGGVAWGAAMNVIPWEFYLQYGDRKMLVDCYEPMKAQVGHMLTWLTPDSTMWQQKLNEESQEPCYWFNLGDWVPPYGMPADEIIHTFYLWLCAENTAKTAKVLGFTDDYVTYHAIAERTKAAFHRKFYDPETKSYGDYGPNVLALWMGVPEDRYVDVVATLRREIMDDHGGHINTGFVSTKFFFETLSDNGLHDVATTAILKEDFPSYGYWIRQGATTTWENWNGDSSHNHPMFGGGLTWFARCLAGVNVTVEGAGYHHFDVHPIATEQIDSVYYSLRSPQGLLSSRVVSHDGVMEQLEVVVPVGSTASVFLPASPHVIKESGRRLRKGRGIQSVVVLDSSCTKVEIGQGSYVFTLARSSARRRPLDPSRSKSQDIR